MVTRLILSLCAIITTQAGKYHKMHIKQIIISGVYINLIPRQRGNGTNVYIQLYCHRGIYWLYTCIDLLCFAPISAFIITPTSVNATLGSTATFTCSASTGVIAWIVDGSLLTELKSRDIATTSAGNIFAMHIPATEEHNNTEVTCAVGILGGEDLYSDSVVLKVQGIGKLFCHRYVCLCVCDIVYFYLLVFSRYYTDGKQMPSQPFYTFPLIITIAHVWQNGKSQRLLQ